jgi:hypothetical protein
MSSLIADLIGFASGEDKEMKCAAVTILALLSRSELTTAFFIYSKVTWDLRVMN